MSPAIPTVLVVEDDPSTADLVELCLLGEGYFFRRAEDGRACLEVARREKPSLIIMDVMMPGMDGFTAASELSMMEGLRAIPILMLTAKTGMRDALHSANVVDFLDKPFDPTVLRDKVRRILFRPK